MAEELEVVAQRGYCKCKSYCKTDSKIAVPQNIDYMVIIFGKTPAEDKRVYWAKSGDIKHILESADTREFCYKSNRSAISGVVHDLDGEFHLVTTKDSGQERGRTNGNYFHFHGLSSNRLLRIPIYDENDEQLAVDKFIDIFKDKITKYYDSLVCETVSSIAGTSCSLIESYLKTILEGKDQEIVFDEDGLFNERLGFSWRDNIVDAKGNTLNLGDVKLRYKEILDEVAVVSELRKNNKKEKMDEDLLDRSNRLKENKKILESYENDIMAYLQQNLLSSYRGHSDVDAIISEKSLVMNSIDAAKKYLDAEEYLREKHIRCPTNIKNSEAKAKPLELFLHLYQLATIERLNTKTDFSLCTQICDMDGGEEHHKIHKNADEPKTKVLVTNLRADDSDHLQMYFEKYRGLVDTLVLFRSPW